MNLGGIIFAIGLIMTIHGVFSLLSDWVKQPAAAPARSQSRPPRRPSQPGRGAPAARVLPQVDTDTSASGRTSMATGKQGEFQRAQIGQTVTVNHPQRGPITGKILGTIRYTELWQRVKSPSEPWVPTGNRFTAHWLGNFMLYEWKENVWLFDQYDPLTDKDIAANFLPYAKRFGESNESADVYFAYPPASWKITDIGKFRVQSAEGAGLRLQTDAVGRFIHASGDGGRALAVEDYQSGHGGQDTAWIGYTITWDDIQKVG